MNEYLILILLSITSIVWANSEYSHVEYPDMYDEEDPEKKYVIVDDYSKYDGREGEYYYDDPSQDEAQYYVHDSGESHTNDHDEAHPNYIEFQKHRYGEYDPDTRDPLIVHKQPYQVSISRREIEEAMAKQNKYYGQPEVVHEYYDDTEIVQNQRNMRQLQPNMRQPQPTQPQQYYKYVDANKIDEPVNVRRPPPREEYITKYIDVEIEGTPLERYHKRPKQGRPQKSYQRNQEVKYVDYVADNNLQRPPTPVPEQKVKQPQKRPTTIPSTHRPRPNRPKGKPTMGPKADFQKKFKVSPQTTKHPTAQVESKHIDVRNSPRHRRVKNKKPILSKESKPTEEEQVIYYIDQPVQIYDPKLKKFHQFEKISSKDAEEIKTLSKTN